MQQFPTLIESLSAIYYCDATAHDDSVGVAVVVVVHKEHARCELKKKCCSIVARLALTSYLAISQRWMGIVIVAIQTLAACVP